MQGSEEYLNPKRERGTKPVIHEREKLGACVWKIHNLWKMLKTYGSNNLYFFFFFLKVETNASEFGVIRSRAALQILLFLLSGWGTRHQTGDPNASRDASVGLLGCPSCRQDQRQANADRGCKHTESFSLLATHEQLMSRALGTGQTHEENKHPLPLATPCLQSTRQRWELQGDLSTITQQPQTSLGFWSTTSFTGSPSHDTRLLFFLVHSFLWSRGQSQPFGLILHHLGPPGGLSWEAEKFVLADAPRWGRARRDQTSVGLAAVNYSEMLSYRNKRMLETIVCTNTSLVYMEYYWILSQQSHKFVLGGKGQALRAIQTHTADIKTVMCDSNACREADLFPSKHDFKGQRLHGVCKKEETPRKDGKQFHTN